MAGKDTSLAARIDVIRSCELFSELNPARLSRLAASSTFQTLPRKTDLFFAGDDPDGLRILVSGMIRIWMNDPDGHELTLALLMPGECFGEIALLDGEPRSANATVAERSELLMLSRTAFEELLVADVGLERQVTMALCRMLRKTNASLQSFAFRGLGVRLALKLMELAQDHADIENGRAVFRRRFSQSELAHMLGATREAINKRMADVIAEGLVVMERGVLTIPDIASYKQWAGQQREGSSRGG